jgi:Ca-activated chloride channel family protein
LVAIVVVAVFLSSCMEEHQARSSYQPAQPSAPSDDNGRYRPEASTPDNQSTRASVLGSTVTESDTPSTRPTSPPPPAPVAAGDANVPTNRDLGNGADTEPLGNLQGNQAQADQPHAPTRQIMPAGEVAEVDPGDPGERYARMNDNPFIRTASRGGDASTFGLDVDSASYANCRRYLDECGRLPPVDAVRIEEFINTMPYDYPGPATGDPVPFRSDTAIAACPWAPEHLLVRLALKARDFSDDTRPPLNLVFLIDTSGSMGEPDKLPLVQESLRTLTGRLDARDHVAIVTYAGTTDIRLPWIAGDEHHAIRRAIDSLVADGDTNGAGGIVAAYREAAKGVQPGTVSRILLYTDGDFNVGTTDHDGLLKLIEQERGTGVGLNVYGFGMGNIKDDTMEMLADHGNGVYGYVDSEAEVDRLFKREAMGQLITVAQDAKVQVYFNPAAVASWRLIGYEKRVMDREDFNDDRVDSGDVGAGHTVTALYEIVPAAGMAVASMPPARDENPFISRSVTDEAAPVAFNGGDAGILLRMRLRWKTPGATSSCLQEYDVPTVTTAMDADFKTAAAAAGFGMLLRCSPWRGSCSWALVDRLAKDGVPGDPCGDDRAAREELAHLIERANDIVRR